jgi:hypothetical protein
LPSLTRVAYRLETGLIIAVCVAPLNAVVKPIIFEDADVTTPLPVCLMISSLPVYDEANGNVIVTSAS